MPDAKHAHKTHGELRLKTLLNPFQPSALRQPLITDICQFPGLWSHFAFGIKEPLDFRRNGDSKPIKATGIMGVTAHNAICPFLMTDLKKSG